MTTTACPHHWIFDVANGPKSHGVCKLCGKEVDYWNSSVRDREPGMIKTLNGMGRGDPTTVFDNGYIGRHK